MSRKRSAVVVALGVLAAVVAGCSSGDSSQSHAFRVALLTPGPVSDGGWNASAYEGLMAIKRDLGAEVSNVQTANPAEFEQGFRDYARQGYDLVIGHGFEYQDAALKVGAEFPETDFVVSSATVQAKNVASLTYHLDEATYLAGIVAASMSTTGKAGCVGGIKLPVILATFDGFIAGAKSVKPDFAVATVYTGSFEDVAGAKSATDALIAEGADFILHNADAAGLGVFQSAKEHHVYAFGSNRDQNAIAPETIMASVVLDISRSFLDVAREVKEKRFVGRVIEEGLKNGGVGFVWNPRLKERVPPAVQQRVAETESKIASGAIRVR